MDTITMHPDSIVQVKVPLPFPLRWVNSYLIRGQKGWTLIDPGLHTEASVQCWMEAIKELNMDLQDIRRIVLTHYHPDHYGLSGWFQEQTGASVHLTAEGHAQAVRLWGVGQPLTRELHSLYLRHGMDPDVAERIIPHLESFVPLVTPQPQITFIEEGMRFQLGERAYETILTPGHASGHLCFYDAQRKVIFCGDHVLPQISPNISYVPGSDENPLMSFLTSLEKLSSLEVAAAYPGHRDPFAGFSERITELIEHHEVRLQAMLDQLARPLTAYQLCRLIFGERLSIHQLRFAMSETLAHVIYLEHQGRAVSTEQEGVSYFQAQA